MQDIKFERWEPSLGRRAMLDVSDGPPPPWLAFGVGPFSAFAISALGVLLPLAAAKSAFLQRLLSPNAVKYGKTLGSGSLLSTAFVHLLASGFDDLLGPAASFDRRVAVVTAAGSTLAGLLLMLLAEYAINLHQFKNHAAKIKQPSAQAPAAQATAAPAGAACCGEAVAELLSATKLEESSKQKFGLYALEFGIAFHSVIVGVTLGAKSRSGYTIFLCAVILHQFLEGFALGSIAAPIDISRRAKVVLIVLFSSTTTVGALMGAAIASFVNGNVAVTTITRGVLSALSGGIMLYSAIVETVLPELAAFRKAKALPPPRETLSLAFFFVLGVVLMTLIAQYA